RSARTSRVAGRPWRRSADPSKAVAMPVRLTLSAPVLALVLALLGLCALGGPGYAQTATFDARIADWNVSLDSIQAGVGPGDVDEARFEAIGETLLAIASDARGAAATVRGTMGVTQQMIDALGPPPGEGAPPEPEVLAKERQRLQDGLAAYQAQAGQAE